MTPFPPLGWCRGAMPLRRPCISDKKTLEMTNLVVKTDKHCFYFEDLTNVGVVMRFVPHKMP